MQCMHVCTHAGRIARNQEKGMGIESLGYTEGDEKETRTCLEHYDMVSYIIYIATLVAFLECSYI